MSAVNSVLCSPNMQNTCFVDDMKTFAMRHAVDVTHEQFPTAAIYAAAVYTYAHQGPQKTETAAVD